MTSPYRLIGPNNGCYLMLQTGGRLTPPKPMTCDFSQFWASFSSRPPTHYSMCLFGCGVYVADDNYTGINHCRKDFNHSGTKKKAHISERLRCLNWQIYLGHQKESKKPLQLLLLTEPPAVMSSF